MRKIRINELARELEVPSHEIVELLPKLGVSEKKTHSSSVDDDLADRIRRHYGQAAEPPEERQETVEETNPMQQAVSEAVEAPDEPAAPVVPATESYPEAAAGAAQIPARQEPGPHGAPEAARTLPQIPVRGGAARPLRPPILGRQQPREAAHPVTPTIVAQPTPQPPAPPAAPPAPPAPARQPAPPTARAGTPAPRSAPLAGKPLPSALRPGQILSGPRAPFPAPEESAMPGAPRPPAPRPQPPASRHPAPPRHGAPSQPSGALSAGGRSLVGQPAARPVVPPRPDMVAKLAQRLPEAPAAPRPGMPQRPASPVPGQPIYRGPIRPGQPLMRQGGPGAPLPGGRGPRPQRMHPTSPMPLGPTAPVPVEQQRRDARRGRPEPRERARDAEGKMLRLPVRKQQEGPPPIDREITVAEGITVKELSEKLGIKANLVIKKLVERKVFATINQSLDAKLAEEIARAFGASTNKVSYEQEAVQEVEQAEEAADLVRRAPVVTVMGHVDHGKTSLLDAIRSADVAAHEAGGITQHIGAYHVVKNGRKIVFIDTPGHEAFTRMRARGAKVTDVVVLVVAADDGVMPQTREAINHAKAAGVPIVVAINKIDRPDAQPDRIKQQLTENGLLAEDWGGDTVMVPVSAKARTNIDLLLEMILLVADMQDLKANPLRPAMGNVLEAQLDRGRGPVATVLVRNGTLRVGDFFICGSVFGKVRAMFDDRGAPIREAEPSTPVEVLGLDSLPDVGDTFQVVTDTAKAKQIVIYREAKAREQAMSKGARVTLDRLHEQLREGETKELNVILKTDVGGTAEVLTDTLTKLSNDKVKIRVLSSGVGAITESDVLLASASDAIIVGFNVRPERSAAALAEQEKVDIRLHTIIYELTDEIRKAMSGMLEPVFKEVYRGRAEVRETFRITKVGTVAGCMVLDGSITRDSQIRLLRDNIVVHTGRIDSLKRFKNDAGEVKSGFECGIGIANFNDVKPGDIIEAFATEKVAGELF